MTHYIKRFIFICCFWITVLLFCQVFVWWHESRRGRKGIWFPGVTGLGGEAVAEVQRVQGFRVCRWHRSLLGDPHVTGAGGEGLVGESGSGFVDRGQETSCLNRPKTKFYWLVPQIKEREESREILYRHFATLSVFDQPLLSSLFLEIHLKNCYHAPTYLLRRNDYISTLGPTYPHVYTTPSRHPYLPRRGPHPPPALRHPITFHDPYQLRPVRMGR